MTTANLTPPSSTPWGHAQSQTQLAPGIWFCSTAGHGGIWLDPERRRQMPAGHRSRSFYEEDCDAAIPLWWFREELRHQYAADRDPSLFEWLERWNPEFAAAYKDKFFLADSGK